MTNPEMPFEAKLQAQYGYLQLVRSVNPLNEHGIAPPPEAFDVAGRRHRIASDLDNAAKSIKEEIFTLGLHMYTRSSYTQTDLYAQSSAELEERASVMAVLTMSETDRQHQFRAGVIGRALKEIIDGTVTFDYVEVFGWRKPYTDLVAPGQPIYLCPSYHPFTEGSFSLEHTYERAETKQSSVWMNVGRLCRLAEAREAKRFEALRLTAL